MRNRTAAFSAVTTLLFLLWGCASERILPGAATPSFSGVREHLKVATTILFEVPYPDATQAKTAVVTLQDRNRVHRATVGLVPGGHLCKPAPVLGLRCSFQVTLDGRYASYVVEIFDNRNKLRYRRSELPADYISPFVVYNEYNHVRVGFTDPTMGHPSRTKLDISPYYFDNDEQISGLVLWGGRLAKPFRLFDTDKTGATSLSRTTITTLAHDDVDLLYDGKSFVNPWIGADLRRSQMFMPFLRVREYVLPSHRPTMTNAGHGRMFANSDGSITFLEHKGIGTVGASGTISEIRLPYEYDIAKGADRHYWALAQNKGRTGEVLARINDDGSLTEFPLPDWVYGSMVRGSDGNFWMVSGNSNGSVRRVSPTGVATNFFVGGNDVELSDLTAGGDGRLWFVGSQRQGAIVVKVDTTGAHSNYALPSRFSAGTVTSPIWGRGGLYFVLGDARMGRMRESGSFGQLRGRLKMQGSAAVAWGPDGALWYPASILLQRCALGRRTASGQVNFVQFAASCSSKAQPLILPNALVAGPNHTLWYTRDDRVGEISL